MSSFLATVLHHIDDPIFVYSEGPLEQKSIHEKVDALTSQLQEMTIEVHQLAESKYLDFKPNLGTCENLESRLAKLQQDMKELKEKINNKANSQISFSTGEFQDLNAQLTECKAIHSGLDHMATIMAHLQQSERALEDKSYSEAATAISEAEVLLKSPLTENDDKINILKALKTEVVIKKGKLDCTLSDLWKEFVKWNIKTVNKSVQSPQDITVSSIQEISLCVSCEGELKELVRSLHQEKLLSLQMKSFADRFRKFVIPLIIDYSKLNIEISTSGNAKTITLIPNKEKGDGGTGNNTNSKKKVSESKTVALTEQDKIYVDVFANLLRIMDELHSMLLVTEYRKSESCVSDEESSRGTTLMSWLGDETAECLLDSLQRTVIAKAVPTSAKNLDGFKDVIENVEKVHDKLSSLGYIQPNNRTLLNSVENVNMLFSNKKSQMILVEARDLMMSGLHDSVAVTEDKPMGEWPPLTPGGVKRVQRLEVAAEHQLSDNTFRMPRCRVSTAVQTLITLAYETLDEATESTPECALQMFLAVRSMFEMFCKVVTTHHGKSLENFPQITALHYNNSMFLAHHLMTLGHQFATHLPQLASPTFVDLIQQIRESGVDAFLSQISRQQGLLLECLDGAQNFNLLEDKTRSASAERSMKQVILQLEHLHKIWKPVLPINNYKKAMGRLINCVAEHITDSVVSLEDISQSAGQTLLELLGPLELACGEMLTSPGEVPAVELTRHVASWTRLVELRLVLDSSLAEVGSRWAGGKGPLASVFKPAELKQLVRALFQNTDRRAALLATIK